MIFALRSSHWQQRAGRKGFLGVTSEIYLLERVLWVGVVMVTSDLGKEELSRMLPLFPPLVLEGSWLPCITHSSYQLCTPVFPHHALQRYWTHLDSLICLLPRLYFSVPLLCFPLLH